MSTYGMWLPASVTLDAVLTPPAGTETTSPCVAAEASEASPRAPSRVSTAESAPGGADHPPGIRD
jgi:hypothetical protein